MNARTTEPTGEPPSGGSRIRRWLIYIGIGFLVLWLLGVFLGELDSQLPMTPEEEADATQVAAWGTATANIRGTNVARQASLSSADETATAVAAATAYPTIVARAAATIQAISAATASAQLETNRDALAEAYMQSQTCADVLLEYRTRMRTYTMEGVLTVEEAHDMTLLQLASSFGAGTSIPIHIRDINARITQCEANQEG